MIFQSLSVAKKDPRLWACYGLDKRWYFYYNTLGLRKYSEIVKEMLILVLANEKFLELERR